MNSIVHNYRKGEVKMRRIWIGCLIILLSSMNVYAETVKLATGEWTPYSSESMDGYGFITEIVSEVLRDMGVTPEYDFQKWKRCYALVKRGKVWAAFPYSFTEKRGKEVLFSDVIGESTTKFFYYKKTPVKYHTLADLKPYKIGGVKGYFYDEAFKKAGLNVSYTSDEISALKKLKAGRVDLMPLNELVGRATIKKNFPDEEKHFKTLEKPYGKDNLMLIVSEAYPNSAELLKRFNESLVRVKKSKAYKIILFKHGL